MKAWAKSLDSDKSSGIRFLGDPAGNFTRALDVEFDSAALLGNNRSKRYALLTEDGKVTKVAIEPDNSKFLNYVLPCCTGKMLTCVLSRYQHLQRRRDLQVDQNGEVNIVVPTSGAKHLSTQDIKNAYAMNRVNQGSPRS
jgi:hypothetical protein